ncbi:monooxygenase [Xylariales sp. PMI_506]|nr:monooxygenase [Xylariales sp. PMI_506]
MQQVAIIGAGLSGLSLALALHQRSIPCTIYESRPDAPLNIGGAVMLSPNALRILDRLGAYERIRTMGYSFATLDYRNAVADVVTEVQEFGGHAKYGYDAMRIYRTELINAMLDLIQTAGVPIVYGRKYSKVVEETDEGVTWEFSDGTRESAQLLVGADGIHSSVRGYLYPELIPKFIGMAGITAAVPTAQLQAPEDLHLPLTYVLPGKGGFVIAPQQVDGSEVLIGKQRRIEKELTREEWTAFMADKESLVAFLQDIDPDFPDVVRRAVSNIPHDKMNVWPFYVVPRLNSWSSQDKHGRVLILGDAAHAIPPSAGQGINQAFEDTYMLALLLGAVEKDKTLFQSAGSNRVLPALEWWQSFRQARVDQVLELNKQIDLRRLPPSPDAAAAVERLDFELGWLYNIDLDKVVRDWVDAQAA